MRPLRDRASTEQKTPYTKGEVVVLIPPASIMSAWPAFSSFIARSTAMIDEEQAASMM